MDNALVSIVVPIYNVEDYLPRCLDSLVAQSYHNIEIICVDDGSSDNSFNEALDYAKQDSRIKVFTKPNGGLSDARNFGMQYVNGKYICFVDSDDYIDTNYVGLMMHSLLQNNSDIAICDMEYVYETGEHHFSSGGDIDDGIVTNNPALININNSACNKLFKFELFKDFKFPKGMAYEDLATIPVIISKATRLSKVDSPLYKYWQRYGSIAHSANMSIFDIYKAIQRCIDYFKETNQVNFIDYMKINYIIHGLDLTTLRIKDIDDKKQALKYLELNMDYLHQYYPDYLKDPVLETYGKKKKLIFKLLENRKFRLVLHCYGK